MADTYNVDIFESKLDLMISNKIQELIKINEEKASSLLPEELLIMTNAKVTKRTTSNTKPRTKTSSKST